MDIIKVILLSVHILLSSFTEELVLAGSDFTHTSAWSFDGFLKKTLSGVQSSFNSGTILILPLSCDPFGGEFTSLRACWAMAKAQVCPDKSPCS